MTLTSTTNWSSKNFNAWYDKLSGQDMASAANNKTKTSDVDKKSISKADLQARIDGGNLQHSETPYAHFLMENFSKLDVNHDNILSQHEILTAMLDTKTSLFKMTDSGNDSLISNADSTASTAATTSSGSTTTTTTPIDDDNDIDSSNEASDEDDLDTPTSGTTTTVESSGDSQQVVVNHGTDSGTTTTPVTTTPSSTTTTTTSSTTPATTTTDSTNKKATNSEKIAGLDGDTTISMKDLETRIANQNKAGKSHQFASYAKNHFKELDTNHDGVLSTAEFDSVNFG